MNGPTNSRLSSIAVGLALAVGREIFAVRALPEPSPAGVLRFAIIANQLGAKCRTLGGDA